MVLLFGARRRAGRLRNLPLTPLGQQFLKFFRRIDVAASRAADLHALSGGFDDDLGLMAVDAFHNFHR